MEKLNTRAAEGYPSRAQEAAGLKQDQFIRTPKSQAKWYTQSRIKQDGNQRPGRTIYGWSGSEARLNSQFSRIAKISSYPSSGPASRPISQEILRRWEQCAREGSLITNHAAGFNTCVSEIQDKMNQHISFLNSTIVKGKAPKEVTDAVKDLKDLSAFHSSVSVALGTAFQHLTDSLFVQLANFILLRRDSYLEYVRPGLKPDTWNKLRNAPLFTYGLFPDDVLAVAEQDIQKHESNRSAPGPGSGTYQHSKKHQFRYQPYQPQFMSLIGLLTATEKQVVSGRLHMRPIQWHLKKHWHAPESLEKVIPIPSSLHVHLRWWLDPAKVLSGQPLHPLQHALQLFTDASNEGWGAHLGDYMAKGVWLESEGALPINLLELKAVLLA